MFKTFLGTSNKDAARRELLSAIVNAVCVGLFFMTGLQNWLRGDPVWWAIAIAVPFLMLGVVLTCRRIMSRIT